MRREGGGRRKGEGGGGDTVRKGNYSGLLDRGMDCNAQRNA